MTKFVLNRQYLRYCDGKHVTEETKPVASANDLNTLMKSVEDYALRILQIRNPFFLQWRKWEVSQNGSHAEIFVFSEDSRDCGDGLRFIIDEVEHLVSL